MSSSSHSQSSPSNLYCHCGERTQLHISKTSLNPGKKFHGCINWKDGGCNFFKWSENPSTTRSQVSSVSILELERKFSVIDKHKTSMVELQRKILVLEEELQTLKKLNNAHLSSAMKKIRSLEFVVANTWLICFIVVVMRL
ncbi:Unknown protein [Striga hermonthica]|uniref:GRF-type domain-containing protein n=1 Tax=Striga hermonthica TaxID=68872 RepID=A0A9N7RQA5_STRHE|nr:Unknown protein [Striga hermonthica]